MPVTRLWIRAACHCLLLLKYFFSFIKTVSSLEIVLLELMIAALEASSLKDPTAMLISRS